MGTVRGGEPLPVPVPATALGSACFASGWLVDISLVFGVLVSLLGMLGFRFSAEKVLGLGYRARSVRLSSSYAHWAREDKTKMMAQNFKYLRGFRDGDNGRGPGRGELAVYHDTRHYIYSASLTDKAAFKTWALETFPGDDAVGDDLEFGWRGDRRTFDIS